MANPWGTVWLTPTGAVDQWVGLQVQTLGDLANKQHGAARAQAARSGAGPFCTVVGVARLWR
eukprot:1025590-Lingulodinium_polyedra.AAC.1